jgi:hemolysin activation/secretion protein
MTARVISAACLWGVWMVAGVPSAANAAAVVLVAPFIEGSSVYSAREFAPLYGSQLGQPVTARSIAAIAKAIEARYQDDGFVMPVITVENGSELRGTPRFFVHEPVISDVRLTGDAGPNQPEFLKYVTALQRLRPIRKDRAQEYLSAIRRLPGVGLRASFEPSAVGVNAYTLIMEVAYHPVSGLLEAANHGSRASGRELLSGRLSLNGMLRQREFLTLEGATSSAFDQFHYGGIDLTRAFGSTWASINVSNAHARPWAAEDVYERNRYALQLLIPSWEGKSLALASVLRFVAWDAALKNDEFGPLSREHIRKIEAGVQLATRGEAGAVSRLSATFVQGLAGFGADSRSYDDVPAADPVFTKFIFNGEHEIALTSQTRLTGRFNGEYAIDAVPNAEQFVFGGSRYGRGLEAADLAGESGATVSVDLEHPSPWRSQWIDAATLYTGVDYAYAWNTNAGFARDHAASTSIGLVLERAGFNSSLELAYPLHRPHFTETDDGLAAFVELRWAL